MCLYICSRSLDNTSPLIYPSSCMSIKSCSHFSKDIFIFEADMVSKLKFSFPIFFSNSRRILYMILKLSIFLFFLKSQKYCPISKCRILKLDVGSHKFRIMSCYTVKKFRNLTIVHLVNCYIIRFLPLYFDCISNKVLINYPLLLILLLKEE